MTLVLGKREKETSSLKEWTRKGQKASKGPVRELITRVQLRHMERPAQRSIRMKKYLEIEKVIYVPVTGKRTGFQDIQKSLTTKNTSWAKLPITALHMTASSCSRSAHMGIRNRKQHGSRCLPYLEANCLATFEETFSPYPFTSVTRKLINPE